MLTDDKCWEILESVNWDANYRTIDETAVKFGLALMLGEEGSERLSSFFHNQKRIVANAICKWEKSNDTWLDLGDDSFGDLCSHVIGMGKAKVDAVVANPQIAYDLARSGKFGESFSYCIPDVSTFREVEHIPGRKNGIVVSMDSIKTTVPALASLADEVRAIVDNPESAPATKKERFAIWDRIANEASRISSDMIGTRQQLAMADEACSFFSGWSHRNYVEDVLRWKAAVKQIAA